MYEIYNDADAGTPCDGMACACGLLLNAQQARRYTTRKQNNVAPDGEQHLRTQGNGAGGEGDNKARHFFKSAVAMRQKPRRPVETRLITACKLKSGS